MPFTPFHCGPAALVKAIVPAWFSLSLYSLVQILIDLESLYNLYYGITPIHAFFHTYLGATIVAFVALIVGKPFIEFCFKSWNYVLCRTPKSRLYIPTKITLRAAIIGCFTGAYSHVLLDSIMHVDMVPFAPLSNANSLLNVVSVLPLHIILFVTGVIGILSLFQQVIIGRYQNVPNDNNGSLKSSFYE